MQPEQALFHGGCHFGPVALRNGHHVSADVIGSGPTNASPESKKARIYAGFEAFCAVRC
jgi:hypothetical protein